MIVTGNVIAVALLSNARSPHTTLPQYHALRCPPSLPADMQRGAIENRREDPCDLRSRQRLRCGGGQQITSQRCSAGEQKAQSKKYKGLFPLCFMLFAFVRSETRKPRLHSPHAAAHSQVEPEGTQSSQNIIDLKRDKRERDIELRIEMREDIAEVFEREPLIARFSRTRSVSSMGAKSWKRE